MKDGNDTRNLNREEGEAEGIIRPARDSTTGVPITMARDAFPGKTAIMVCTVPYQDTRTNVGTTGAGAPSTLLHYLSSL